MSEYRVREYGQRYIHLVSTDLNKCIKLAKAIINTKPNRGIEIVIEKKTGKVINDPYTYIAIVGKNKFRHYINMSNR